MMQLATTAVSHKENDPQCAENQQRASEAANVDGYGVRIGLPDNGRSTLFI
jgi:hypothetical protein